jgi:hypothetical protein
MNGIGLGNLTKLKFLENLRLSQFARTKYAVLYETPVGNYWLVADNYKGKKIDESEEPKFSCREMEEIWMKRGEKPLEVLKAVLLVKKHLGGIIQCPKQGKPLIRCFTVKTDP